MKQLEELNSLLLSRGLELTFFSSMFVFYKNELSQRRRPLTKERAQLIPNQAPICKIPI
jgi:hypothetical protein